jgi:hypothetical protein
VNYPRDIGLSQVCPTVGTAVPYVAFISSFHALLIILLGQQLVGLGGAWVGGRNLVIGLLDKACTQRGVSSNTQAVAEE